MTMKQLLTVLVAALFAAASVNAVAQEKKGDGMEKKAMKSDKAKKAAPKKAAPKKTAKKTQKKGEDAKK
jgi:Ni/Co efflux regulator RcnB